MARCRCPRCAPAKATAGADLPEGIPAKNDTTSEFKVDERPVDAAATQLVSDPDSGAVDRAPNAGLVPASCWTPDGTLGTRPVISLQPRKEPT